MLRKVIVSSILICAFLLAGGIGYQVLVSTKQEAPKIERHRPPMTVRGTTLAAQTIPDPLVGYGTAQADVAATITAEVRGEVIELHPDLKVGAAVKQGELLVQIDPAEYAEQVKKAENLLAVDESTLMRLDVEQQNLDALIVIARSELDIAEREYQRVSRLREADQAATREFDRAQMSVNAARRALQTLEKERAVIEPTRASAKATKSAHEADLELANIALDKTRIVAPFDCVISMVGVERGERMAPGRVVVSLLDPRLIEVPIQLPASERPRVTEGARTVLSQDSLPGVTWEGRVARISPTANMTTRTFDLFVEVDNTKHQLQLLPGTFVRSQIDGNMLEDVILVPRGAVRDEHVFVARDGKAWKQRVTVDRLLLEDAIVRGLEPGQTVITTNLDALDDGSEVRVMNGRYAEAPPVETSTADASLPKTPAAVESATP